MEAGQKSEARPDRAGLGLDLTIEAEQKSRVGAVGET
jgi:hypothetical protein